MQISIARDFRGWIGARAFLFTLALGVLAACTTDPKVSAQRAAKHVEFLRPAVAEDVKEVRVGLPQGAPLLAELWQAGQDPAKEPEAALDGLNRARNKVQDLRLVKSTLFALTAPDGRVIRSDQSQDLLAGKNLFDAFGALRAATQGKYVEATGSMHEARGVEGKPDGQWLAAQPVSHDGNVVGLYVSGWAWSLYAYRLETALKGHLIDLDKDDKPLFYVFVVVGKQAFGTRISPEVNAQAIEKLDPLAHLDANGAFETGVEITGRQFGLAVKLEPSLGPNVAIAVLRSET